VYLSRQKSRRRTVEMDTRVEWEPFNFCTLRDAVSQCGFASCSFRVLWGRYILLKGHDLHFFLFFTRELTARVFFSRVEHTIEDYRVEDAPGFPEEYWKLHKTNYNERWTVHLLFEYSWTWWWSDVSLKTLQRPNEADPRNRSSSSMQKRSHVIWQMKWRTVITLDLFVMNMSNLFSETVCHFKFF
jgi:hypothetical protein